jgi:hypothetical protein
VTSPEDEFTVHPDVEVLSTANVTGLPDAPPVAAAVYVVPGSGFVGAVLVKTIVCTPSTEVTVCCCTAAAEYEALPAWCASITHVPAGAVKVTSPVEEFTVHPDVEVLSTVKVTGLPDPPPVAATV